jgi:uncharacterized CHY-type Zn-finger protein
VLHFGNHTTMQSHRLTPSHLASVTRSPLVCGHCTRLVTRDNLRIGVVRINFKDPTNTFRAMGEGARGLYWHVLIGVGGGAPLC